MKDDSETRLLAEVATFASRGNLREALAKLDQREPGPRLELTAMLMRAQILERLDTEECWRTYTSALEKFPDDAAIPLRAGVFTYKRGDLIRAQQLLMKSWQRSPSAEAGYYLARITKVQSQQQSALEYLVQTVALEGEDGYWRKQAEQELTSA